MQNHEVDVLTLLFKTQLCCSSPHLPCKSALPYEDVLSISESQGGYIQTHPAQMWRSAGHTGCEPTLLNSATIIIIYFSYLRTLVTKQKQRNSHCTLETSAIGDSQLAKPLPLSPQSETCWPPRSMLRQSSNYLLASEGRCCRWRRQAESHVLNQAGWAHCLGYTRRQSPDVPTSDQDGVCPESPPV